MIFSRLPIPQLHSRVTRWCVPLLCAWSALIVVSRTSLAGESELGNSGEAQAEETERKRGLDLVLEVLGEVEATSTSDLLDALVMAGPRGRRELFQELDEGTRGWTQGQRTSIERALRGIPRELVARKVQRDPNSRRTQSEDSIALAVLQRFGSSSDLETLFALVTPKSEEASLDLKLAQGFGETIESFLRRDASTYERVELRFASMDARLWPATLRGVGAVESAEALKLLCSLLGENEDLTVILMSQIGRVATAIGEMPSEGARIFLMMALSSIDLSVRREACITLGRVGDSEAAADLLQLLSDSDEGVARNAHWALQRISGKRMSPKPEQWHRWFNKEQEWWTERSAIVLSDLKSVYPDMVSTAIREVGVRRLYRRELAEALIPLLRHESEPLVSQVAATLANLKSPVAIGPLQSARDRLSDRGQAHVDRALKLLSELD